jgi:hypothetical protein
MTVSTESLNDLTIKSIQIFKTTEAAKADNDITTLIERLYTLPSFYNLQAASYEGMPTNISELSPAQLAETKQIFVSLFSKPEVTEPIDAILTTLVTKYIEQINCAKEILVQLKALKDA